jgi:hypothetical protein
LHEQIKLIQRTEDRGQRTEVLSPFSGIRVPFKRRISVCFRFFLIDNSYNPGMCFGGFQLILMPIFFSLCPILVRTMSRLCGELLFLFLLRPKVALCSMSLVASR